MYKTVFTALLAVSISLVSAQIGLDEVLTSVVGKNKRLAANAQFLEARRLQYKTGLTPVNPTADYDYMIGKPVNAGNQTDIVLKQAFDFPSAYRKKSQVADRLTEQLDFEGRMERQEVMLEAKLICIELIGLHKLIAELENRVSRAQRVNDDITIKLQQEEVSLIDANKAKLVLLNTNTQLQMLQSTRAKRLLQLAEMNGGEAIDFQDAKYPLLPVIPDVDSLEQSIEAIDPLLKLYESQLAVGNLQVRLSKAMALPKMDVGYHYQAILGQTFNGLHLGISIPLWESKNTVLQSKAYALFTELELEKHSTNHRYEIRELYKHYETLKASMQAYEAVLDGLSSEALLQQSLELEQLSFIEYALEMQFYYSAVDQYMQLEKEFHLTVAKLYKHTL